MGIYLVAIVENSKGISLKEFVEGLYSNKWGRRAFLFEEHRFEVFEEFVWKGKRYFTWIRSPRAPHLGLYGDEPPQENPLRVLLFKVFRVMERLAGGPIHVGNDVIESKCPDHLVSGEFFLPFDLDSLWPQWREVADTAELEDDVQFIF